MIKKKYVILYSGHKGDKYEFGRGLYISGYIIIIYWILNLCEIICKFRVKINYYNFTLISTHAPTEEKDEIAKEEF